MPKLKKVANDYETQDTENPVNMAGAHRLIMQGPEAVDAAMKRGLGAYGFTDAERRKMRRDAGSEDR